MHIFDEMRRYRNVLLLIMNIFYRQIKSYFSKYPPNETELCQGIQKNTMRTTNDGAYNFDANVVSLHLSRLKIHVRHVFHVVAFNLLLTTAAKQAAPCMHGTKSKGGHATQRAGQLAKGGRHARGLELLQLVAILLHYMIQSFGIAVSIVVDM